MKGVGPGTVLGGRYAVRDRLTEDRGVERWSADDTTLGRRVSLLAITTDDHRAAGFLDAARRAASVGHPVLVRILDVGQDGPVAYVVEEQLAEARTLTQLVGSGGVPGDEVRRITGEVATALESARQRGMHHLDLTPDDVLRTPDGEVRLRGLETAAVRAGEDNVDSDEAARRDAVGVVALAYAGLTGRWPLGAGGSGLGPAPRVPTGVASPSEIGSGVPRDIDAICRLTLNDDQGPTSPGDYARQVAPWPSRQVLGKPVVPVSGPDPVPEPTPEPVGPDGPMRSPDGQPAGDAGTDDDASSGDTAALPALGAVAAGAGASAAGTAAPTASAPSAASAPDSAGGPDDALDGPPYRPAGSADDDPADEPDRPEPPAWLEGPGWDALPDTPGADGGAPTPSDAETGSDGRASTDDGRGAPAQELAPVPERAVARTDDGRPEGGTVGGTFADAQERAGAAGTALVTALGTAGTRVSALARRTVDRVSELSPDTVRGPARPGSDDPDYDPYEDDEDLAPLVPAERLSRDDSRLALGIVAAFLALALVIGIIGVRQIGSRTDLAGFDGSDVPTGSASPTADASSDADPTGDEESGTPEPLAILKVSAYDPEGDGAENNDMTPKTYDGDTSTGWYSENYRAENFGGLKSGVGLIVDLGPNKKPQEVRLTIPQAVDLQVSVNSEPSLEGATAIGEQTEATGEVSFAVPEDVNGQYVVLWYTGTYPDGDGKRRAWLNEVVITG